MLSLRHRGQAFLVGAIAATISLLRQFIADPQMFKSIWAEDGWMPLCVVARGHGSCLFEPVNGYWPAVHRILAEGFALLPLGWWPFLFPIFASLMMGVMSATTFLALGSIRQEALGLVLAIGIPLTPSLGVEFINVIGNVHWILLVITMLLMFSPPQSNWTFLLVLVSVTSLTNPVGFVLVGLACLLWFVGAVNRKQALFLLAVSLISWLMQLVMILGFNGTNRVEFASEMMQSIERWSNKIVGIIPGLQTTSENGMGLTSFSSWLTPSIVVLTTVSLLVWLVLSKRFGLEVRKTAAFGLASQVLVAFVSFGFPENPRYVFVLLVLNAIWITALVGLGFGRLSVVAVALVLVLLPLPALKAGSYRTTHSQIDWPMQIENARLDCHQGAREARFNFAPVDTYRIFVPCRSLGE